MKNDHDHSGLTNGNATPFVVLAIACFLLAMVAYRHSAATQWKEVSKPVNYPAVIIELVGGGNLSGIYFFSENVDSKMISAAMDIDRKLLTETGLENRDHIFHGSVIVIGEKKIEPPISVLPMAAKKRIALGIPLDLNVVTAAELMFVPGIGPELAKAIVAYRSNQGEFSRIEDVTKVKGIGPKRLQLARKYLMVSSECSLNR